MKFFICSALLFSGIIQNIYSMEQEEQSPPPSIRLSPPCELHIKSDNSLIINNQHYPDIKELINTDPELTAKLIIFLGAKTRKLNHTVKKQDEEIKKLEEQLQAIKSQHLLKVFDNKDFL